MKRGLVGVLRVEKVLRLPARKSLDVYWWRVMWCACDVVLLVAIGEVGGGAFGGVFWLEVLYRFARGESGGVVNPLLFVGLYMRGLVGVCMGWCRVTCSQGGRDCLGCKEFCECEFATL